MSSTESSPRPYRPTGAARYASKQRLASEATPFVFTAVDRRQDEFQGRVQTQLLFTIRIADGPHSGESQLLTLFVTPSREELERQVQAGAVGPVTLEKVELKNGATCWVFRPADGEGPYAEPDDDLPF
jgi:hypothetical protein